ncbi:phosphoglycerate kinase [Ectocarpus siliculosus]|uniref:Phosphoglycerate kinase n=1 Tax=Ectocarpus siliculosus TaxID=2880 RepID=D8LS77_ECTSI|nr:phosphoglycerate kinase [Ectocarpus siliculosus]|eukprot:CBN75134.1 phosphoglycerate kinase [Ectocarpus siliculosus]
MSDPTNAKADVRDLADSTDLTGKRVFVRVDLNAPLSKDSPPAVTDATRLSAACPTITFLADKGAKVILASHLGRPKKQVVDSLRMDPVAAKLSELLGKEVIKMDDCIGTTVEERISSMGNGEIMLLENVRFHSGEESNDEEFSKQLAALCDYYVNDAFGTAHRAHASTEGITKFVDRKVSGMLMEKELKYLKGAVDSPVRPMACIVGGAKVSSKITVIEALIEKCDVILLGGGMIFTFYKAKGLGVGKSLVEDDYVDLARDLMSKAEAKGVKMLLPEDVVVADKFSPTAESDTVTVDSIPEEWMGLDVGPKTISAFEDALAPCKTIVWNGPMGVFEFDKFAAGTFAVASCLADLTSKGAITIIGGGDSVAAVEKANLADKMSHISTGGGASLELLEGKELPGVNAIEERTS